MRHARDCGCFLNGWFEAETRAVLWQSWWWFGAVILLLALEWALRKRAGMM